MIKWVLYTETHEASTCNRLLCKDHHFLFHWCRSQSHKWSPRLSSRKPHRCGWSWKPGRTNPGCPHQWGQIPLCPFLVSVCKIQSLLVLPLTSVCSPPLDPLGLMILTAVMQSLPTITRIHDDSWWFLIVMIKGDASSWSGDSEAPFLPFAPALGEPKPPPLNLYGKSQKQLLFACPLSIAKLLDSNTISLPFR